MGFEEGRIVFNNENGVYYSGQTVFGNLIFDLEKSKTFRGLYVKIKGFCKVHWSTSHTRTVNGRTEVYNIDHNSYEDYLNQKIYLVGSENGELTLHPGHYEYPFKFIIPSTCPSSFEGTYGHIRYEVKAVVDRPLRFDQEKKAMVQLIGALDLNTMPEVKKPVLIKFDKTYYCCCTSYGKMQAVVKLPVGGYYPGQLIPIEVICNNDSSVAMDSITVTLKKDITFHAQGTRTETENMSQVELGGMRARTSHTFSTELMVPNVDSHNLLQCRYIDVSYRIKVNLSPDGCHRDSTQSHKIVIGTIPLHGVASYSSNSQDEIGQLNVPVVHQPLPTPYPGANIPYPREHIYTNYNMPQPDDISYHAAKVIPYPSSYPQ